MDGLKGALLSTRTRYRYVDPREAVQPNKMYTPPQYRPFAAESKAENASATSVKAGTTAAGADIPKPSHKADIVGGDRSHGAWVEFPSSYYHRTSLVDCFNKVYNSTNQESELINLLKTHTTQTTDLYNYELTKEAKFLLIILYLDTYYKNNLICEPNCKTTFPIKKENFETWFKKNYSAQIKKLTSEHPEMTSKHCLVKPNEQTRINTAFSTFMDEIESIKITVSSENSTQYLLKYSDKLTLILNLSENTENHPTIKFVIDTPSSPYQLSQSSFFSSIVSFVFSN